ncbi:MAG: DNA polymerase III subunit gamma/tau [Gammaproteobacteria bacterium]|jgi:DNA polymerase-3 subunit gamma/tau|nr:DNA polymerase III subunit gamma/tau [Gammaproteobacteria bacterium]MDP6615607.1 DNA polymerase III subunit gamma/tau [Gammaproteobacteria bacterium]MDP6695854.1 DNA polymerase III subunit gamma/tau [Gammaproteobacteria bacterium]MDP7041692.1 DNA polymerase III subunit gamma/tau [Gammaproteobacteria bacterium]
MSYLALARKWRPKIFADVAGQDHVVRALTNALKGGRVHHAYLFAGTRGVGKTTVARILAKALNCEAGVNTEPCGECSACTSIDEGRFVDLIEVDAASRTKVDDTRDLLENVQYTPSSGRYKVYLIDEVHMLSGHSFNALLKTLEEPPPHVKFLLATTDPQKLPVTVLSRCLQFNLKRLSSDLIVDRMALICEEEKIKADGMVLPRIARAASGSMRDALSLLDQALAFGGGELRDDDVAEMLGSLDQRHIGELLECLTAGDAPGLLGQVRNLQELVPDYESVLNDLATVLQQIAVLKLAGPDSLDEDADTEMLAGFADQLSDELVQLFYQIAVTGRRDISLAPDPRLGFEMTLLRMVAFRPAAAAPPGSVTGGGQQLTPGGSIPRGAAADRKDRRSAASTTPDLAARSPGAPEWPGIIDALKLTGALRQLAENCELIENDASGFRLHISRSNEHLLTDQLRQRLAEALRAAYGDNLRVQIDLVDAVSDTVALREVDDSARKLRAARDSIQNDPDLRQIIDVFGAEIENDAIRPVNGSGNR